MKRLFFIAVMALSLCGCGKIIDWWPINFYIQVVDAEGKDLLDPENDNSWIVGTQISFYGESELIEEEDIAPQTRTLPAEYRGCMIEKGKERYQLIFGEFPGGHEYDNEELVITWPDGTSNKVTYKRRLNSVTIEAKEVIKLDGVKCSNPIVIVK